VSVSDMLQEISELLPENIFVYEINLRRNSLQKQVQLAADNVKQCLVVRRTLNLILCGYNADQSDADVQMYINAMTKSSLLSKVFTQIKPSARHNDQVADKDTVFYEIECTLKEQSLL
jgi:hypothetical protein